MVFYNKVFSLLKNITLSLVISLVECCFYSMSFVDRIEIFTATQHVCDGLYPTLLSLGVETGNQICTNKV